jgi:hypothetical protein
MSQDAVKIRALAVDDHPLLRVGIAALIADETDIALFGEAADGREAVEQFRRLRPDWSAPGSGRDRDRAACSGPTVYCASDRGRGCGPGGRAVGDRTQALSSA